MITWLFQALILGSVAFAICAGIGKLMALISDNEMEWIYYLLFVIMLLGALLRFALGSLF